MGNHALGRVIGLCVQGAYEARQNQTALQILDKFCSGSGGDAEWEAEDPLTPGYAHPTIGNYTDPTPDVGLGMLMVEAFAPNGLADLPKYSGVMGYFPSDDPKIDSERRIEADKSNELWYNEVYVPFKKRYNFW